MKSFRILVMILVLISGLAINQAIATEADYYNKFRYDHDFAVKTVEIKADDQMIIDYGGQTDGLPLYICHGPRGAAGSDDIWIIFKYTYDGNRQLLTKTTAFDACDDRASATYQ